MFNNKVDHAGVTLRRTRPSWGGSCIKRTRMMRGESAKSNCLPTIGCGTRNVGAAMSKEATQWSTGRNETMEGRAIVIGFL